MPPISGISLDMGGIFIENQYFQKYNFPAKTNLFYFLQKTSFYSYRFLCLWIFGILNGNTDLTISVKMEGIL